MSDHPTPPRKDKGKLMKPPADTTHCGGYPIDHPTPDTREARMVVVKHDDTGTATVWCDPEIVDLIAALNDAGLKTVASCSGHGYRPGFISLHDGRHLFVATQSEADTINAVFPLDINGDLVGSAVPTDTPTPDLTAPEQVQRYDMCGDFSGGMWMTADNTGDYVRYEDYAALFAKLAAAEAERDAAQAAIDAAFEAMGDGLDSDASAILRTARQKGGE